MYVTNDSPTVYFDVDSTLVFTGLEVPTPGMRTIEINLRKWWVHDEHVECIKDFHARGHNVVVWSQGGAQWAASVVSALGMVSYVRACLTKPNWIFDDKPAAMWLNESHRSYINLTE